MAMTEMDVIDPVREYIRENFLYMKPDLQVEPDDRLLERGIIDSMGVVELLQFIEDKFGIKPGDDEITEENLGSLRAIARFVMSKATQLS